MPRKLRMRLIDLGELTADHGCDPTTQSTDHSREHVPLLVYGNSLKHGVDLGTRSSFCDLAATLAELLRIPGIACGTTFARNLMV